jgi:hypothetical protein
MAMWLYQLNQEKWPPARFRLEIWEGQKWSWLLGRAAGAGRGQNRPEAGDIVVFFGTSRGSAATVPVSLPA